MFELFMQTGVNSWIKYVDNDTENTQRKKTPPVTVWWLRWDPEVKHLILSSGENTINTITY